jgi:glycerol-1-phosphate dehydrogenase [NAD(P)+]
LKPLVCPHPTPARRVARSVEVAEASKKNVPLPRFFHQDLMRRIGPNGILACDCGREHRLLTRDLLVGEDALARSADLLVERYGRPRVYVLSDENTEAAAGARWKSAARASRLHSRILPASPKPVPTEELAGVLLSEVKQVSPDVLVSVGSGVLSDLGKKISLDAGVPNWCLATAASVDAYTSASSAIHIGGYHRAIPGRVSEVVVCDLEVIARAPRMLFLAGLGDLLAKFLAHLDWVLAHRVAGDPFCATLASFALGSARQALEAAGSVGQDVPRAMRLLTDAALVSGLAMQALGSSRPAASAEHTIAHFWDAAGAVKRRAMALHGIEVGAATRLVLPGYLKFYGLLAAVECDVETRLAAFDKEPRWEDRLEEGLRPFELLLTEENRDRSFDRTVLARRLVAFRRERQHLADMAEPLLEELGAAIRVLEGLGFPFSARALGIAPAHRLLPVRYARLLRNRYTTFDLAYELGNEDALLGPILAAPDG